MADKKTVYLFFGDDTYSSFKKVNTWRSEFEKKHGDINISLLEGKKLTSADFESDVFSTPFLGEKRLIIIKDFLARGNKDEQKKVADVLELEIPDFSIVVFHENGTPDKRTSLYKKLNKVGNVEEFKELMGPALSMWILKEAQSIGVKITNDIADYIGSVAGSNLWNIHNELQKLKTFAGEKTITRTDVDNLVHPNLTASIFKFTDYLAEKNASASLKTMNILIESGEDIIKILFMIIRHFRILIQVHDLKHRGLQKGEITSRIKEHPFTIATTLKQSPNFSSEKLKAVYEALLQIDIGIKTGKIKMLADDKNEGVLALEKLILNICKH